MGRARALTSKGEVKRVKRERVVEVGKNRIWADFSWSFELCLETSAFGKEEEEGNVGLVEADAVSAISIDYLFDPSFSHTQKKRKRGIKKVDGVKCKMIMFSGEIWMVPILKSNLGIGWCCTTWHERFL